VFGYCRTTGGFDARRACDRRRYEYVLPAWAFDPDLAPPPVPARAPPVEQQQQAEQEPAPSVAQQAEAEGAGQEAGQAGGTEQQGQGAGTPPTPDAAVGSMPGGEAAVADAQPAPAAVAAGGMAAPTGEAAGAQGAGPAGSGGPADAALGQPASTFVFDDACVQRLSAILKQVRCWHARWDTLLGYTLGCALRCAGLGWAGLDCCPIAGWA
jgi:tRNA U38,U39,U40 pseudouridine synthase TruA